MRPQVPGQLTINFASLPPEMPAGNCNRCGFSVRPFAGCDHCGDRVNALGSGMQDAPPAPPPTGVPAGYPAGAGWDRMAGGTQPIPSSDHAEQDPGAPYGVEAMVPAPSGLGYPTAPMGKDPQVDPAFRVAEALR